MTSVSLTTETFLVVEVLPESEPVIEITQQAEPVIEISSAGMQGPTGAAGLAGRTILSGAVAPVSGSGLEPLDGTSDPWRWSPHGYWVGPACSVTWSEGDTIPTYTPPAGAAELDIWISTETTFLAAITNSTGPFPFSTDPILRPEGNAGGIGELPLIAVADGSGIAFLIQFEPDYYGPTTVPDASVDIADYLGDVTVVGPYTWPESAGDGNDGDFWLNTATEMLYGPKVNGVWPAGVPLIGPTGPQGPSGQIVLGLHDPVPPNTPVDTVIVRRAT